MLRIALVMQVSKSHNRNECCKTGAGTFRQLSDLYYGPNTLYLFLVQDWSFVITHAWKSVRSMEMCQLMVDSILAS